MHFQSSGYIEFGVGDLTDANGDLNIERHMTLDTIGRLGIGTTAPAYKLEVVGDAKISDDLIIGNHVGINMETTGTTFNFDVCFDNSNQSAPKLIFVFAS